MTNGDEVRDGDLTCARCGQIASWLVALRYDRGRPAGRLMPYCDGCMDGANPEVRGLSLPIAMFRLDPERLLELMYQGDATRTDPDIVAEMLRVAARGAWYTQATRAIARESQP